LRGAGFRFGGMSVFDLCPVIRAPRSAAFIRSSISFSENSMSGFLGKFGGIRGLLQIISTILADLTGGLKAIEARADKTVARIEHVQKLLDSSEQNVLFATVGRALTAWSKMEESMVAMVGLLLRVPTEKAGLMMYSILNFNSWLGILNDLFALDNTLATFQKRWSKISERARKIKDKRDQLAHHSVVMNPDSFPAIRPSRFDVRQKTKLQKQLDAHEINEFTEAVIGITVDVQALIDAMDVALGPSLDKSAPQGTDHSEGSGFQ
jgi:hypothetical protein